MTDVPGPVRSDADPRPVEFEQALSELEEIVRTLERGDLPLERSLELFERGVQLSRFCHSRLEAAERRIEILTERGQVRDASADLDADPDGPAGRDR